MAQVVSFRIVDMAAKMTNPANFVIGKENSDMAVLVNRKKYPVTLASKV